MKLFLAVILFFLLSCENFKFNEDKPRETPVANWGETIKLSYRGLPRPNEYEGVIAWQKADGLHFNVLSPNVKGEEPIYKIESTQGEFATLIAGGQSSLFKIEQLDDDGHKVDEKTFEISPPADFVVTGQHNLRYLDAGEKSERLFLMEGALITTYDIPLKIVKKEFYSFGGTIETYPENSVSRSGHGSSGGTITINVEKAMGKLFVNLRGENGKDGDTPKEPSPVRYGDGEDAVYSWGPECHEINDERGHGAECIRGTWMAYCDKAPTNGTDAGPGAPGLMGGTGGNGGNTGDLTAKIDDGSKFLVVPTLVPGKEGGKGRGGPGQRSLGGYAGWDGEKACPQAHNGKDGPQGPQGPEGKAGNPGHAGKVEIDIKHESRNL